MSGEVMELLEYIRSGVVFVGTLVIMSLSIQLWDLFSRRS